MLGGMAEDMRGERVVVSDDRYDTTAAGRIGDALRDVVAVRGRASLCLAGGTTPGGVYRELAGEAVPWDKAELFLGDERRVPAGHVDSNWRMVVETLISRLPTSPAAAHAPDGGALDAEQAAREYDALLPNRVDVLLLGMGSDGHTASLFPRAPALAEQVRRFVPAAGPAGSHPRLTITPRVIREAGHVFVLVRGEDKAAAVAEVLSHRIEPDRLPVQHAIGATWILDTAAASRLRGQR
jgi:6-phosphogluconolactonase